MTQTEELSISDLGPLDDGLPRRPEVKRRSGGWWWPLAAGAAACLLIGGAAGYLLAPSDDADPAPASAREPEPTGPSEVVEPGALLGGIAGATRYRSATDPVERYAFAWPGQELAAPGPSTGDPVAWQWELCDVPAAPAPAEAAAGADEPAPEPAPLECDAVADATDDTFASPPTNRTRLVRVIVTVDLGGGTEIQAASTPIAAVAWPDAIQPGDPPPAPAPVPVPPVNG